MAFIVALADDPLLIKKNLPIRHDTTWYGVIDVRTNATARKHKTINSADAEGPRDEPQVWNIKYRTWKGLQYGEWPAETLKLITIAAI